MNKKFRILTGILFTLIILSCFPTKIYAVGETVLAPNTEIRKRLTDHLRTLSYIMEVDKSGYQFFDFEFEHNENNRVGNGITIEVRDKEKKLIHRAIVVDGKYTSPKMGIRKGDDVYITIEENFDYVHELQGVDIRFKFYTVSSPFYEGEDNNTLETSNRIVNRKGIYGNLHAAADEDWYMYKIPSGGETTFHFTLNQQAKDKLGDGYSLELYDSNKNLMESKTNLVGNTVLDGKSYKKGETVFIKIFAYNSNAHPYMVEYHFLPKSKIDKNSEKEPNNGVKKASKILRKKSGFLMNEDDKDFYVYQAPKSKNYKITFKTERLQEKKYVVTLYRNKKLSKKNKKVFDSSKSFGILLKKGEKLWIEVKGVSHLIPVAKDYEIRVK